MTMNDIDNFFNNSNSPTAKPKFQPKFANNQEPRCPVILLLDTSGSMSGEPIKQLNAGINVFKQEVNKDSIARKRVEVAIITFGSQVKLVQDFVTIDKFEPKILNTGGATPMGEAIETALPLLENCKAEYKDNGIFYYRPWVFLISDGVPTDNWLNAAQQLQEGQKNNKLLFFAVGVNDADLKMLEEIGNKPAVRLKELKFQELFLWLSNSVVAVSTAKLGEQVSLSPVAGWGVVSTST